MTGQTKTETNSETRTVADDRDAVSYTPRFDILEQDDELLMYGDLPGVGPEDLDIQFENGELTVHGRVTPRQTNRGFMVREYGVGDFYRTFAIGETIDSDKISAELKHGVLTLHLPKVDAVKPRRIEVRSN